MEPDGTPKLHTDLRAARGRADRLQGELDASEARGRQYCLELAEKAHRIRELESEVGARKASADEAQEIIGELTAAFAVLHSEELESCGDRTGRCKGHLGERAQAAVKEALRRWLTLEECRKEDAEIRSALHAKALRADVRIADLEAEIRLLRRERVLLIDLEKGRSRVIGSLLSVGGATADDVNFIRERSQAVAALHLEASGGIERPEGSACACILCSPQRKLGRKAVITEEMRAAFEAGKVTLPADAAAPVGKALPPEVPAAPPEEPLPTAEVLDLMQALKASLALAARKPRKPEEGE